jgi:tRNA threonylcarbamoyl adenosine modification protein YeaZ
MLLAIDTSAGTSVAIVDSAAGIHTEHSSADTRRHAEVIGELIKACLDTAGVAVTDLTGVVAGMGPGPFTGLRVGIAAARVFALGAAVPLLPVISHDAIAWGQADPVLVATDARRHEVYWSTYSGLDAARLPMRVAGPLLAKAAELELPVGYRLVEATEVSAAALGLVAEAALANGRTLAPNTALYLRSPDVTLSAGPKRVTS